MPSPFDFDKNPDLSDNYETTLVQNVLSAT